ncbi:receptor-like serine/threonine-protein kinase SD1-7 [Euphorbia lathyris]|uniref:receptor-like serine/threonine-protein kinase SD1-7 n=1 Tax=Euphorbia lathyris TaxID=212925 RepID=UPI00331407DB
MDDKSNPWFLIYVLFTCFFLHSYLCVGFGTISANQSLSGDQTISSEHGKFILGFFNPGNSSNYYIGIWYNSVSQAVVWVANRETPVSDKYSSTLAISDGNLVLLNDKDVLVWSTNLSSSGYVEALLLDDGNLVLRDETISSEPVWQSFDYPTNTWLPGSKIGYNKITKKATRLSSWKNREDPAPGLFSLEQDMSGNSQFYILLNRSQIIWNSGNWNGQFFSLIPEMTLNYIYNFSYIDNENESYFSYSVYNSTSISRLMIDVGGQTQQMTWLDSEKQWALLWSQPRSECVYCGGFGICVDQAQLSCECLSGFHPKSVNEWNSQVYADGCVRKTSLQCSSSSQSNGKTDAFSKIGNVVLPKAPLKQPVSEFQECESTCLEDCSCTAFAIYKNGSCSIWHGDLLFLRQLPPDDANGEALYIRLAASEFSGSNTKTTLIGVTAGSVAMLLLVGLVLFVILKRRRKKDTRRTSEINYRKAARDEEKNTKLVLFSFKSILAATNNFSEANKLGEGGFGPVYKGTLPGDVEVAIKRLSKKSGQGIEEFMNELKLIANLQHKYLVRLLGSCVEREEKMLIYEYMPNRSLDIFLFDQSKKARLAWDRRFKIIEGVAQGLLYMHKFSRLKVIHRDLKASNVLLDEDLSPKISDFGMARIFGIHQTEANTNRVMGTYGYMSPEYAFSGQFSEKSDVFSFGVLLLEIVTGKRNTSFHRSGLSLTLLSWVWELWKEGKQADLIDASVKETCCLKETVNCISVGLLCVQEDPIDRPTMSLVVTMLTADTQTLPSPKQPAFHSVRAVDSSPQRPNECSNSELTISLPVGR